MYTQFGELSSPQNVFVNPSVILGFAEVKTQIFMKLIYCVVILTHKFSVLCRECGNLHHFLTPWTKKTSAIFHYNWPPFWNVVFHSVNGRWTTHTKYVHTTTHAHTAYTFLFQSSKPPFWIPLPHISTILKKFVSFGNTKWFHAFLRRLEISKNAAIFGEIVDLGMTRGQGGWPIFSIYFLQLHVPTFVKSVLFCSPSGPSRDKNPKRRLWEKYKIYGITKIEKFTAKS